MFQHVNNEIAGFTGTAEFDVECAPILIEQTTGDVLLFGPHVMVIGADVSTSFSPARVVSQGDRRFAVETQSSRLFHLGTLVFGLQVVKD